MVLTMLQELLAATNRMEAKEGAAANDGVIQQVIDRINGLWPAAQLRPIETVLAELRSRPVAG
jgi:hypothetical protein